MSLPPDPSLHFTGASLRPSPGDQLKRRSLMATKRLALRVSVNGKRLCTVGLVDGAATAMVGVVGPQAPAAKATRGAGRASLVVGIRETDRSHLCPWWVLPSFPALEPGDEVSVQVVLAADSRLSKPKETHRIPKSGTRPPRSRVAR